MESRFTASLDGMLEPRERLALPGASGRMHFLDGYATLEHAGALDWTGQKYARVVVRDFLQSLAVAAGLEAEDDYIIALAEFLCVLVLAAAQTPEGRGGRR